MPAPSHDGVSEVPVLHVPMHNARGFNHLKVTYLQLRTLHTLCLVPMKAVLSTDISSARSISVDHAVSVVGSARTTTVSW